MHGPAPGASRARTRRSPRPAARARRARRAGRRRAAATASPPTGGRTCPCPAAGGSAGRRPGRGGRGPPGRHRRCRRRRARRAAWSTVGRGQGTPSITTSRSEWPGTSTPSLQRVGAEQAGVGIVAEDVDQRAGIDRIDMLGVERQAGAGEPVGDPGMDRLQPLDRGEQAQRAALRPPRSAAHRRRRARRDRPS